MTDILGDIVHLVPKWYWQVPYVAAREPSGPSPRVRSLDDFVERKRYRVIVGSAPDALRRPTVGAAWFIRQRPSSDRSRHSVPLVA